MLKYDPRRWILPLFCAIPLFLATGCEEASAPAGVVATVNGEPITLHAIQALIDSRSSGLQPAPSVTRMKKNYGRALKLLIAHALARQELAAMGKAITPGDVDNAIQEARDDYGKGGLEEFLATASIRMEDWRDQMRDHLALEAFQRDFLLPGIKVDLNEVREYYNAHKSDFLLPDNVTVCLLAAENRKMIDDWCKSMERELFFPGLISQCLEMREESLPQEWQKEFRGLKPGQCARPRLEDGEWRTVALLASGRGRQLELAETYALIENILLERKRAEAFDKWLFGRLGEADIKISPELRATLDLADDSGEAEEEAGRSIRNDREEIGRMPDEEKEAGGTAPNNAPD